MLALIRNLPFVLLGLILGPFLWLFSKLRTAENRSAASPQLESLNNHLWNNGVRASLSVVNEQVDHCQAVGHLRLGLNPSKFQVVTVTFSESVAEATLAEEAALSAPQYTAVQRNGKFVMACTFQPPDAELEKRVSTVFLSYRSDA